MISYPRNFLFSRCLWWKCLDTKGLQTSRHCYAPSSSTSSLGFPLDKSTWSTIKSLGILRSFRGRRAGRSLLSDHHKKAMESSIPSSPELNIQNDIACSTPITAYSTRSRQTGKSSSNLVLPNRVPQQPQVSKPSKL